jgi:hypothetical protein
VSQGREEFERQLQEIHVVILPSPGAGRTLIDYRPRGGRFKDQAIRLGFEVPPDFPRNPPGGPHVSPRLLPINPSAPAHPERTADSSFGPDFQYWSRPFPNWKERGGAAAYMGWVDHLFDTT